MDDDDRITAKRELGEGRWDKILKRKMTELSVDDDYKYLVSMPMSSVLEENITKLKLKDM